MNKLSLDEKFETAVNIIKRLPQEGSFKPSNDLKLKFYSYYKQATEGPCNVPQPSIWEIVNRTKWNAWKKIGNMAGQEAKEKYIEGLIEIMKGVNFTESSDNLEELKEVVRVLGPFVEVVAPKYPILNKVLSSSSYTTEDNNNVHLEDSKVYLEQEPEKEMNGHANWVAYDSTNVEESENEEYSDSSDQITFAECSIQTPELEDKPFSNSPDLVKPVFINKSTYNKMALSSLPRTSPVDEKQKIRTEVNEQLAVAILKLQRTMDEVVSRIHSIELHLNRKQSMNGGPSWWPGLNLSVPAMIIIMTWPFLVNILMYRYLSRKTRH